MAHISVLLKEVVDGLHIKPEGTYLDATSGGGGHARAVLERLAARGRIILCDADARTVGRLTKSFGGDARATVSQARFSELRTLLQGGRVDGLIADLGFSSLQLEDSSYGLSFLADGPLDMRLDQRREETALGLIDAHDAEALGEIIREWGEERHARHLARIMKAARSEGKLETTKDLKELCERALGKFYKKEKIHPATRVFQALRIAVNREMEELDALLESIPQLLAPGGRAAVISFHSLEDRKVKNFFKQLKGGDWKLVTKKPILPSEEELKGNPRSRSAKLRIIERTS